MIDGRPVILATPLYANYGFCYWGHDGNIYRVPDDDRVRLQMEGRGRFSFGCLEDILAHPQMQQVSEVDRSYGRRG